MRQLGLKTSKFESHPATIALLGVILTALSCTRAANHEPIPPSASSAPVPPEASGSSAVATPTTAAPQPSRLATQDTQVFDDTTRVIAAKVGGQFTINLPANITTPYKWVVASTDGIISLTERHYEEKPPTGCTNCVGYPGTDRLTFEAKKEGSTKLILRYAPLRSKTDPAERELAIDITISKP